MWLLALISILVCIALWCNQILHNIKRKKSKCKEKVIKKLDAIASDSPYEEIYDNIIERYENSSYNDIEEIVKQSKLPRHEKQDIIQMLNKLPGIGVDEKTGLHKQTLVIGRILGYSLALIVVIIYVVSKQFDVNVLSVILVYAGVNVLVTFVSYMMIETYIVNGYKFLSLSSKKPNAEEGNEVMDEPVKKRKVIDRIYDVLDIIFGN